MEKKKLEGNYLKYKKHGKWTYVYENGKKHSEGEYYNNKKVGHWTYWRENGIKVKEEEFTYYTDEEGRQVELIKRIEYYDNGNKMHQSTLQKLPHYKQIRIKTYWYKNGKKRKELKFKDGQKNDIWNYWHENGIKSDEIEFENDLVVRWTRWDENGHKIEEQTFVSGKDLYNTSEDILDCGNIISIEDSKGRGKKETVEKV